MRNNKGRGSGLALILILTAALIVAYLAVTQLGSPGTGRQQTQAEEQQQDPVNEAQDAVDAINQRIQEAGQEP